MILLTTVPHTGTRFWLDIIERATGYKHHVIRASTEKARSIHPLASCHIEPDNYPLIEWYMHAYRPTLITTTRDHDATVKSWRKRGLALDKMHQGNELQERLIRDYSPIVVSVDAPDREERLHELSQAIGRPLRTEWKPVGQWAGVRDGAKQDRD